jgi:cellulose 1,4-beta-cellobiosidase
LKLGYLTKGSYSTNIGSRVYLLGDESHYKLFKLENNEFTFTVDDSSLECGLNVALYHVAMEEHRNTVELSQERSTEWDIAMHNVHMT